MTPFGDYPDEMPLDEFSDEVQAFARGVRAAATHMPASSPLLNELLASGVSVNQPKQRSVFMKIKTWVAGLGVAGKVVLGAGMAAAAAGTGAGAVGVLPVFNEKPATHEPAHNEEAVAPTPTTVKHDEPKHDEPKHEETTSTTTHEDELPVVTPTTVKHEEPREEPRPTTTTTVRHEEPRPTTTTTPPGHGDGDNNNPESIALTCIAKTEPNRVICEWTPSSNPDHKRYVLMRTSSNSSQGRVLLQSESQLRFEDHDVVPGVTYFYRVASLRSDGTTESHSNGQTLTCC